MLATTTTTITSDPGILCFHHCNVKVFCFKLPHICPNCNAELVDATASTASDDDDDGDGDDAAEEDDNDEDGDENGDEHKENDNDDNNAGVDNFGHVVTRTTTSTKKRTATKKATTTTSTMRLLPFRLPYPFVRATQYPCAIVLRPSSGDFLNDYNNATDLHIAVTTSGGDIVEFDRDGLQRHRRDDNPTEWWQSLLVGDVPEPWYDYWDDILQQICAQNMRWSIARYAETSHNCYTFVLAFLQALGYEKLSEAAHSKTSFCEKYIVPRTTTAGKYISLYRKLRDAGIYVHQQQQQHHQQQQQKQQKQKQQQQQQLYHGKTKTRNSKGATTKVASDSPSTSLTSPAYTHSIISRPRAHKLCTIEE